MADSIKPLKIWWSMADIVCHAPLNCQWLFKLKFFVKTLNFFLNNFLKSLNSVFMCLYCFLSSCSVFPGAKHSYSSGVIQYVLMCSCNISKYLNLVKDKTVSFTIFDKSSDTLTLHTLMFIQKDISYTCERKM